MNSLLDHLLGPRADDESVDSEARLRRMTYRLNVSSILFATIHVAVFLILALPSVAAVFALGTVLWAVAGALMRRGRHDAGRRLQHATGLTLITMLAVAAGPAVSGQIVFLIAAAMPPLIWTRKERVEWAIHLAAAFALWTAVESGLLDQFAKPLLGFGSP